ncbi:MAG: uncharacterized protein QOI59_6142 [Gammaproteobacteria bacterium]|jgi:uncharacterized protein (UPF0276 family)|nr:uncharacterized protein [Gammaproteobacteria bacterium]
MINVAALGVGFPYIASMPADFYQSGVIDFVEIAPETLCFQRGHSLAPVPQQVAKARAATRDLPMVVHGVELSIGSAHGCNTGYLEMLDLFQASWPFVWHSEHLGFQTIAADDGATLEVGVPLPLPATREAAELVAERAAAIGKRYGVPFLLENPAYYIPSEALPHDPQIVDDIGLMNRIMTRSGCYQLLDLHNIYCNALNHHLDPFALIDRVDLDRVIEIHLAGGSWRDGFWMDGHNGRVPPPVWRLLEYTLIRAPNAAGVVFEVLDQFAPRLGREAITEDLRRARAIWDRCHPVTRHVAA